MKWGGYKGGVWFALPLGKSLAPRFPAETSRKPKPPDFRHLLDFISFLQWGLQGQRSLSTS